MGVKRMIREYLTLKKAKKIMKEFDKTLPTGVECKLEYSNSSYREWTLRIKNRYGPVRELNRKEDEIKEIINAVYDVCKRFDMSFDFHSHGLDYVYISIEVK
jgi:hypothetical protein